MRGNKKIPVKSEFYKPKEKQYFIIVSAIPSYIMHHFKYGGIVEKVNLAFIIIIFKTREVKSVQLQGPHNRRLVLNNVLAT